MDPARAIFAAVQRAETPEQQIIAAEAVALRLKQAGVGSMRINHSNCDHPHTASAQRKCRAERAVELFGKPAPEPTSKPGRIDHSQCTHPHTAKARQKCRDQRL